MVAEIAKTCEWSEERLKYGFRQYISFMRNSKSKKENDLNEASIVDIVDPFYDGYKELQMLKNEL